MAATKKSKTPKSKTKKPKSKKPKSKTGKKKATKSEGYVPGGKKQKTSHYETYPTSKNQSRWSQYNNSIGKSYDKHTFDVFNAAMKVVENKQIELNKKEKEREVVQKHNEEVLQKRADAIRLGTMVDQTQVSRKNDMLQEMKGEETIGQKEKREYEAGMREDTRRVEGLEQKNDQTEKRLELGERLGEAGFEQKVLQLRQQYENQNQQLQNTHELQVKERELQYQNAYRTMQNHFEQQSNEQQNLIMKKQIEIDEKELQLGMLKTNYEKDLQLYTLQSEQAHLKEMEPLRKENDEWKVKLKHKEEKFKEAIERAKNIHASKMTAAKERAEAALQAATLDRDHALEQERLTSQALQARIETIEADAKKQFSDLHSSRILEMEKMKSDMDTLREQKTLEVEEFRTKFTSANQELMDLKNKQLQMTGVIEQGKQDLDDVDLSLTRQAYVAGVKNQKRRLFEDPNVDQSRAANIEEAMKYQAGGDFAKTLVEEGQYLSNVKTQFAEGASKHLDLHYRQGLTKKIEDQIFQNADLDHQILKTKMGIVPGFITEDGYNKAMMKIHVDTANHRAYINNPEIGLNVLSDHHTELQTQHRVKSAQLLAMGSEDYIQKLQLEATAQRAKKDQTDLVTGYKQAYTENPFSGIDFA